MKTQIIRLLTALALCASLHQAAAQGTAFNYQGQMSDGGLPANGTYDVQFTLYDDASLSLGHVVGTPQTKAGVTVNNGALNESLDFGSTAFIGGARWLELGVRPGGSSSAYTILSPRQELTPTPYAIYAENSAAVANSSVSAPQLNTGSAPTSGEVLTYNGSGLVWMNPSSGGTGWSLTGNSSTVPGVNFLGTTDPQPLELRVNGARALRLEPDVSGNGAPNVIGGAPGNTVSAGWWGSTIAGGGSSFGVNSVDAPFGTIGGGVQNSIQNRAYFSTISGGLNNTIQGYDSYSSIGGGNANTVEGDYYSQLNFNGFYSAIGGGSLNTIKSNAPYSTIGGGLQNTVESGVSGGRYSFIGGGISNRTYGAGAFVGGGGYDGAAIAGNSAGFPASTVVGGAGNSAIGYYATVVGGSVNSAAGYAFVGGGVHNTASGFADTVPGGSGNTASGGYSFAAGDGAQAVNQGSFVWSDFSGGQFSSTANNQFSVRANGGVRFLTGGAGVTIDGVPVGPGGGGGSGWGLAGNTGTDPSVNFLGTTDGAGLELRANNLRGLRLEYSSVGVGLSSLSSINVNGGYWGNTITRGGLLNPTVLGGTIAGGGYETLATSFPNSVTDDFGTIGGGNANTAGLNATVPGGANNSATGDGSFAAGRNAQTTYDGSFIWGDGTQTFNSSGANHFDVLATGGVNFRTVGGNGGVGPGMSITSGGRVGINTPSPQQALDVEGEFIKVVGGGAQAGIGGRGGPGGVLIGSFDPGVTSISFVNLFSTPVPMHINCSSITIQGGADLAEPFQVSTADKEVAQGAVLVIDEENPGHLKLSDRPYDTRVAGVVSGANGINPGIQMQQQGLIEGGKNVALTGRVYVMADASNGPIKPGDLLTSSTIPGRAMKVNDHARAQGAILGKAMTALTDGKGMVLVLVTLQ